MNAERAELTRAGDRFSVRGPLTFATVMHLCELPQAWDAGRGAVTVDLAEVPRADSAGLALLLEWLRAVQTQGRALNLVNVPARLRDLMRVTNVADLFPERPRA